MKDALRVTRSAVVDLWDHIFLMIFCSLAWLLLVLLIIPGPPATLALFDMAERIARREHLLAPVDYLRAVWNRFGVGWRWGAVNLVVLAILVIDIRTIPRMVSPTIAAPLQIIFFMVLVFWIIVNWYALAFLFQQKEPSLRQALRNGAVLLLQNPLLTLILVVVLIVVFGLSVVLVIPIIVLLLVGPMLVALIGTHAVLSRLTPMRSARREDGGAT
jgi:hypothetical protein